MDSETITALAREYAEEMIKGKPSEELPNCLKNSMLAMNTEYIAEIFQWLTRRYYLVEKEAVRKEYHEIKLALGDGGRSEWEDDINMGKEALLKSLFPDLGKEVEQ